MTDLLPLFPLPNVVLFPGVFLPLHVFEPRYREMVADALASDRLIGMVLLKPGWEHEYEGRPPVYPIGCSGVITHVDQLPDGRYNIVLRGVERFRIVEEDFGRAYRLASVESMAERALEAEDRGVVRRQRSKLEMLLASARAADNPHRLADAQRLARSANECRQGDGSLRLLAMLHLLDEEFGGAWGGYRAMKPDG